MMMIGAGAKTLIGGIQAVKGLSMNPERPTYEIPDEAQESLNNARRVASMTEIPGASILRESLKENMANSIFSMTQASTSPSQILAGVGGMQESYANEEQKLAIAGANMYMNNQGMLRQELNRMADREDQKFVINKLNPYVEDMERKQSLIGGGLQNIMGGVDMAGNAMGYKMQMDYLNSMMGGGNNQSPQLKGNAIDVASESASEAAANAFEFGNNPNQPAMQMTKPDNSLGMMFNPFNMMNFNTPESPSRGSHMYKLK
jgi:hypothetical protein